VEGERKDAEIRLLRRTLSTGANKRPTYPTGRKLTTKEEEVLKEGSKT